MSHETKTGFVLLACALFALPVIAYTMDTWDQSERKYDRECDVVFRIIALGNVDPIDPVLCEELKEDKQTNMRLFIGLLSLFIATGVGGLVMVLPFGNQEQRAPPSGGQLL